MSITHGYGSGLHSCLWSIIRGMGIQIRLEYDLVFTKFGRVDWRWGCGASAGAVVHGRRTRRYQCHHICYVRLQFYNFILTL